MAEGPYLNIVQLGLGGVGQALLSQYIELAEAGSVPGLAYLGIADRSGLCIVDGGWTFGDLRAAIGAKRSGRTLFDTVERLASSARFISAPVEGLPPLDGVWESGSGQGGQVVVVDVTAERNAYDTLLDARLHGAHVVMCNKWTLAESTSRIDGFLSAGSGQVRYETTVGAALPVIGVLDSLLATRDEVSLIEAAISGTLGYLCSEIERGVAFSAALRRANRLGYTEPDPRDDLGGLDARRKALILARKLGHRMDMADVRVQSLVPAGLESVTLDEFWRRLPEADDEYRRRVAQAAAEEKVLRFLARIDGSGASVGLIEVPRNSLPGSLVGTESLFVFHTRRYGDQPLAIRGRGAGADLTASGVMSDILGIAANLRRL